MGVSCFYFIRKNDCNRANMNNQGWKNQITKVNLLTILIFITTFNKDLVWLTYIINSNLICQIGAFNLI